MKQRQQSSTSYPITFLMVDSSDHVTGKTGLTPTVTISKNGAAFGSPSGVVSEIGNGWYALAGSATDRDTLGDLLIHATGTGADPVDDRYVIVPWNPFDAVRLGLTAVPNAAAGASGGLPVLGANLATSANVTYSAGVAVSSRLAEAADLPAAAPTADVVADAVWDEMIADHAVAGSTGEALDGATAPTAAAIWSYVSRTLTATPAQTTDGTTASAITRKRGNSWSISLTLGAITGYTSLWFTVKRSYDDMDSAALVQIKLNASGLSDGLLTVNGAAATNDALGSITVSDATTGAIVIALDETVTDDIAPGVYYYDAQALISGDVSTPDSGTLTVTADVTRSVA